MEVGLTHVLWNLLFLGFQCMRNIVCTHQEWSLCFSWSCGALALKPHWPSKPNALGLLLPMLDPQVGVPDVGLRTHWWKNLCDIIIFPFMGHSPSGYEIWLCHENAPPPSSFGFFFIFGCRIPFFVKFQSSLLMVIHQLTEFGVFMRGSDLKSFYYAILSLVVRSCI